VAWTQEVEVLIPVWLFTPLKSFRIVKAIHALTPLLSFAVKHMIHSADLDGHFEEELTDYLSKRSKDSRPVLRIKDNVVVEFGITLNQIIDVVSFHSIAQ